ncbi:MAG: MATE family efflux transporter [Verrucomicrobiota bacterium]
MQRTIQLVSEGRQSLILAFPLIAGLVSQMLIGVADTLMIGRLGEVPLAAATFSINLIHLPFMFGIGMAIAVSVRVSQARGAENPIEARAALRHGLLLTLGIGALTVLLAAGWVPLFPLFQQKPEVIEAAPAYFMIIAVSMIPGMGSVALKSYFDAMNRPWPAFWVTLGGVVLNIFLNWVFIYGNLGAPRMELEGAGLATVLARSATLIGLIVLCHSMPELKEWVPRNWLRKPDWMALRHLIKIGWPTSIQIFAEVSAFVAASIVIGTISVAALAAHQVAITCVATVFMIPLGLSQALTVRIGETWGAGQYERWRPIVINGWCIGIFVTLFSTLTFVLFRNEIAHQFLPKDPEPAKVAAGLLLVAAAFQLADALQVVSAGALRGLNDVKAPAWIAFVAYWVISLPLGYYLAFHREMGVNGIWWGLTVGLSITAAALGRRLWVKTGPQGIERLAKEHPETGRSTELAISDPA